MAKRPIIEALCKAGYKSVDIAQITSFSYKYITNIVSELKKPGTLKAARKRWLNSEKGRAWKQKKRPKERERLKTWKKLHPQYNIPYKRADFRKNQLVTKPHARKHRQEWILRDISYLQKFNGEKTTKELALDLGRTYSAVLGARNRYCVNRGNENKTETTPQLS